MAIKDEIIEEIDGLEKLLSDRISELHNLCGKINGTTLQAERHAFILYRNTLWDIRNKIIKKEQK